MGSISEETKAGSFASTANRIRHATSLEHLERMMTQAAGIGNTKTKRRVQAAYEAARARLQGALHINVVATPLCPTHKIEISGKVGEPKL